MKIEITPKMTANCGYSMYDRKSLAELLTLYGEVSYNGSKYLLISPKVAGYVDDTYCVSAGALKIGDTLVNDVDSSNWFCVPAYIAIFAENDVVEVIEDSMDNEIEVLE